MKIQITGLEHTYPGGVPALRGVSLEIETGECVAIVGQNGAGKTTLVKHLNSLLRPTAGVVQVGAWDTRQRSVAQMAAVVGYVFQNPDDQLFQRTTLAEVSFGPRNMGWPADRAAASAQAGLERVGLADQGSLHPYDLSPSQRKRVALAAVLAMQTPIVVLDEPTTGQDAQGTALIGDIIRGLRAEGRTVIAVTHDVDFCAEHFERVIAMGEGRVLADGLAQPVLAQTRLLAATNVDPPQLMRLAARLGWPAERWPLDVEAFATELAERAASRGRG